jgi:hypothetical protein
LEIALNKNPEPRQIRQMDFKKLKGVALTSILLLIISSTNSQPVHNQNTSDPQLEYAYLHTDKYVYQVGEKIWYATYLRNAENKINELSVITYVDLTDINGNLLLRNKQKCIDGISHGTISIPEQWPSAQYVLRVYTQWMKNFNNNLDAVVPILIIHPGDTSARIPLPMRDCSEIATIVDKEKSSIIDFNHSWSGKLVAQSRGILLAEQVIDPSQKQAVITIENPLYDDVSWMIYDSDGNQHCQSSGHTTQIENSSLELNINKTIFKPREKVTLEIVIKSMTEKINKGKVSVSVARNTHEISKKVYNLNFYPKPQYIASLQMDNLPNKKEQFLYPPNRDGLKPLATSLTTHQLHGIETRSINLTDEWLKTTELTTEIDSSYQTTTKTTDQYDEISLPYDNKYKPDDYVELRTVEDFFREIVPQIKTKQKHGQSTIFIRNTEDKNHAFVYKKPPLIVVDGVICNDLQGALALDPGLIDKITLSWKSETLSKVSLVKLADNGVLAIYSKPGMQAMPTTRTGENIYQEYHRPLVFQTPEYPTEIPDFRSPIYWKPNLTIDRKEKISFLTSDELGDFVIEVKGMTDDGSFLHQKIQFTVAIKE